MVVVEASAAGKRSLGYSYADTATAKLIEDGLKPVVLGRDAMAVAGAWQAMVDHIRNLGRPGICSMAISAVDNALWDLKARVLGVPLVTLLGAVRKSLPIYGSGGFTSYSDAQLREQFSGWVAQGISRVKMKIGRQPASDLDRVASARAAIGDDAELFVDANGAYSRKQALKFAHAFTDFGVTWFEEPVSSDDLDGLRLLRDSGPPGMGTLREEIERGTPIVGLEPSCVAVFRDEMLGLFPGDENAQRLSKQTMLLAEFLETHAPHASARSLFELAQRFFRDRFLSMHLLHYLAHHPHSDARRRAVLGKNSSNLGMSFRASSGTYPHFPAGSATAISTAIRASRFQSPP